MSGELDHVTVLAMRLCAVRNDTSVAGERFVELVREFARSVVAEFKATANEAFRELQELERTAELARAPVTRHVPTLAGQQEGPARHRAST